MNLTNQIQNSVLLYSFDSINSRVHGMHNIKQNIKNHRIAITNLRKTRQEEGLELVALSNKISSANGMLKQYNLAIKEKKESLLQFLIRKSSMSVWLNNLYSIKMRYI